MVWDNRMDLLDGSLEHQRIIFEEQTHRIQRLVGKVDVVVTDSPILFSVLYSNEYSSEFDMAVRTAFSNYNNFNLSINRGNDFDPAGRIQTEAESLAMADKIQNYLRSHKIFCITYDRDDIERIVGNIHNTYEPVSYTHLRTELHPAGGLSISRPENEGTAEPNIGQIRADAPRLSEAASRNSVRDNENSRDVIPSPIGSRSYRESESRTNNQGNGEVGERERGVESQRPNDCLLYTSKEPLLVLVSFDGETIIASQIDEAVEHHILLAKAGYKSTDIDRYFRVVVDDEAARCV